MEHNPFVWPFDELTTQHIGLAFAMLLTSLALYIKIHASRHRK